MATVTQPGDLALLAPTEEAAADILEFRLDDLVDSLSTVKQTIETLSTPAIVTARHPDEGGSNALDSAERLELYRAVLPAAAFVDTEIATLQSGDFAGFVAEAHAAETLAIASYHDFSGFPGIDTLARHVETAYDLEADIAKVAVVIESMSQLFDLVTLVERQVAEGRLVSAMGMGPLGKLSRLVLAKAGSCLNYGYLRIPNAPGQWSASDLARLVKDLAL
ncbi:MAG: type I 3-dehydroquinate dehydratase [Verrucomicrobiales bacterium]